MNGEVGVVDSGETMKYSPAIGPVEDVHWHDGGVHPSYACEVEDR